MYNNINTFNYKIYMIPCNLKIFKDVKEIINIFFTNKYL